MVRFFALLSVVALSAFAPAYAAPKPTLKQTIEQLETSKKQEKELATKLRRAQDALKNLQAQATRIAADVQQSETRLFKAEKALHMASKKRDATMKTFSASKETYRATVMTLLRMQQLPPSVVLVPPEQQDTMRRTAMAVTEVERVLRVQLSELRLAQERFEEAHDTAVKARDVLAASQKRLRGELASLEDTLGKRKKMYDVLSARHAAKRAQVKELAKTSKNLQELIAKLDAKSRVQASRALSLRSFTRAKGALRSPVAGSVKHAFGTKKSENERYRGLVLASRNLATVVAPYDGEIAYSGSFREYGPMVLIRHSDGYMSLLAGLSQLNVLVGTKVRAGEPVGKMGTATPNLYVELRKSGKPIDPAPWYAKL